LTLSLKTKIITIFATLILLTGCNKATEEKIITKLPNFTEVEEIPVDYKVSLFAVGDALIHDAIYIDAKTDQIGEDGYNIYNFKPMLEYIAPLAQSHDLAFYNQETIIGGKNLGLSNYPMFNSPDEIGLDMLASGFNIVNLATNHTMDKGVKGATYSANFWEKQDAYITGSYTSEEKRNNIEIKEKNGITYAVLGYTYGTNGLPVPNGYEYLVNVWSVYGDNSYEEYKETVKQDIKRIRDKVDVLIVSMHWGNEYTHVPTWYEKDAAQFLSEQGVDLIIGTHPHVIQPIEYVNNTLVIYSLGNFISSQNEENTRVGLMVSLDINKHVENNETTISINNVKADLVWTHRENYKKFKAIPFYELNNNILNNYEQVYEKYKKIINTTNDERIQVGF
jgi:poly-gamma-glutamate synthesis protein (capsule biosynthesis protein)